MQEPQDETYSDKESQARFEATLRGAMKTPHKPLKAKPAKKAKKAKKKSRAT